MPYTKQGELERQRKLREERERFADEAMHPGKYQGKQAEKMQPADERVWFYRSQVTHNEMMLWYHLDTGVEHLTLGKPAAQTDEQLAETFGLRDAAWIAEAISSLAEKGLIRFEQARDGSRRINTMTAKTCGL